ncbi:hypothetical protein HDU98_003999, partial [Podochytrium sp. JEL0797]
MITVLDMTIKLTLALEWTPNTNYIGFYAARARGYYASEGIELLMSSRHQREPGHAGSGAEMIKKKEAHFCITTKESIVS